MYKYTYTSDMYYIGPVYTSIDSTKCVEYNWIEITIKNWLSVYSAYEATHTSSGEPMTFS